MASADLEIKAKEAFVDDDFDRAVDLYSRAIDLDPGNAGLYADRAQANIKLESYTDCLATYNIFFGGLSEAVADANKAIELDPSMVKAYLRKGIACFKLEEYQTAKTALEAGLALIPGDSRFTKLIKECDEHIAEEIGVLPKTLTIPTIQTTIDTTVEDAHSSYSTHGQTKEVERKPKYRHDYYNTATEVVITFFAKGIPANNVSVDFGEQILSVEIDCPGEEKYHFQSRLFGKIIPDKCRYQVLSTKIEIRLFKAETITWTSLDYADKKAVPQKINTLSAAKGQRPTYPSSKSKVDWDKLEAQVKKEEKEEKLDGDAALNKFFKDIYSDADEDMRRAMSKSFVESNGTVLSTNWKEVGAKKVEGSPPSGMDMKKWEY